MFKEVNIIGPVLEQQVLKNAKINASSWAGKKKKNLSPSTSYMCMTKTFFDFKFSETAYLEVDDNEFTYSGERAKEIGNNFHSFIERILKNTTVLRLFETTLTDEENHIRARLDLIVEINGTLYIVELKSAKSYSVKMMKEENSPDIEHQKQLQLYFHLYDKCKNNPDIYAVLKGRPITKGIILYEEKESHKITEFFVPKNQKIIDELLRYGKVLFEHIKKDEKPNFKFEPDSRECIYKCRPQYYLLCHGKEMEDREKKVEVTRKRLWGTTDSRKVAKDKKFV